MKRQEYSYPVFSFNHMLISTIYGSFFYKDKLQKRMSGKL